MTITLAPTSPAASSTGIATGTTIQFTVTASAGFITKTNIGAVANSQLAVSSQRFSDGILHSISGSGLSIQVTGALTCTLMTDHQLFEAGDVGKQITITGAVNAANNGVWTITAWATTSSVTLTRGAGSFVTEVSGFTWALAASNIFTQLGSYNFSAGDIGKSITLEDSSSVGNNIEVVINSVLSSNRVRTSKAGGFAGGPAAETGLHWTLSGTQNGWGCVFSPTTLLASSYTVTLTPPDHLPGSQTIPVTVSITSNAALPLSAATFSPSNNYIFTTSARPRIQTVNPVVGDPFGRNIRVIFDLPLTNSSPLQQVTSWMLSSTKTPPDFIPTIYSVVPESVVNPTYVDLRLSRPMVNSGQYVVELDNSAIFGIAPQSNKFDVAPYNQKAFFGFGVVPQQALFKDNRVNTPAIQGPSSISFAPTSAKLRWAPPGQQGALLFTAKVSGVDGNSLTVWLRDPGAANQPLHLVQQGNNLTVWLATNTVGTVVSSVQDVNTALVNSTVAVTSQMTGLATDSVIPMASAQALTGGAALDPSATYTIVQNDPQNPLLGSLDPDVVSIAIGPNSDGVTEISEFVNNLNGSGTFKVVFDSLKTSYKLSVVVTDNVDNVSLESNVLSVEVLPETLPGLELSIAPYRGIYAATLDRLLNDVPESLFIAGETYTIPYTYDPFPFSINVVDLGMPVFITISQNTQDEKPQTLVFTHIPTSLSDVISLPMERGKNYIFISDGIRSFQIIVMAATYASALAGAATEIFDFSRRSVDDIVQSVFNDLSTRLAEPYLNLYEVLPSVRPQQQLSMKLAIKSYVSNAGQQRGVVDLVTAMTLQTPYIQPNRNSSTTFEPNTLTLFNTQEAFSGSDVNVWLHNTCASRWLAFIKYLRNFPDVFRLLEVDDSEVVFVDDLGVTRKHRFNLLDPACSTLDLGDFCFDAVSVGVKTDVTTRMKICAASYPSDMCFGPEHPLGNFRGLLDSGIPWDSGIPLDSGLYGEEGYLDPGHDGWAGVCITPHYDDFAPANATPPQEFDPILGEVVVDGFNLRGFGTHFLSYVRVGSRVYLRNENVSYTVTAVVSDELLVVSTAPPARPHSGTAATFSIPTLTDPLADKQVLVSGVGAETLPTGEQINFWGPIVVPSPDGVLSVPTDVVLDSGGPGTGILLTAAGSTLTVPPRQSSGIGIAKTSDTTCTATSGAGIFVPSMVGQLITIASGLNAGQHLISGYMDPNNLQLTNTSGFVNEASGVQFWSIPVFTDDMVGQTILVAGSSTPANNGPKLLSAIVAPNIVQLNGTIVDDFTLLVEWRRLPARGRLTMVQPLFRASDVGRQVGLSGCLYPENDGQYTISSVGTLVNGLAQSVDFVGSFKDSLTSPENAFQTTFHIGGLTGFVDPFLPATVASPVAISDTVVLVDSTDQYSPTGGSFTIEGELFTYTGVATGPVRFTGCSAATTTHQAGATVAPVGLTGRGFVTFPDYVPLGKSLLWYTGTKTELKLLSGIPLDSMTGSTGSQFLGACYVLDMTIPPQSSAQPEVPFFVTGINTKFLEDLEVGFQVYFPQEPEIVYTVVSIPSDLRVEIVKVSPPNTVTPPYILPPHSKVVPVASGDQDATLVVNPTTPTIATLTVPSRIFTIPSIGRYINFPNRYGVGTALTLAGGVLNTGVDTFSLSDVGLNVRISGAVTPGNNGLKTITSYIGPQQVGLSGIVANEPVTPNNKFMWQVEDTSTTTSHRLGEIVELVGAAPTNQVLVRCVIPGEWVDATNNFAWELLPDPILISEKVEPECLYVDGFRTLTATLVSADVDLTQKNITPDVSLLVTCGEPITIVPGVSTSTFEILGASGLGAGNRPYFLTTDVGNSIYMSSGPNLGVYVITQWISPKKVEVSGVLVAETLTFRTWTMANF